MSKGGATTMHRRVNITLPEDTLRLIDRAVDQGNRSRFIDEAVRHFVHTQTRAQLRKLLKEGAQRHAARDRALAEEWFPLDEEAWQKHAR
jgi:CopG family transcriptional regulator/antitoxin EndoAI